MSFYILLIQILFCQIFYAASWIDNDDNAEFYCFLMKVFPDLR